MDDNQEPQIIIHNINLKEIGDIVFWGGFWIFVIVKFDFIRGFFGI